MNTITDRPFFKALNERDISQAEIHYQDFASSVFQLCSNESRSEIERFFILNYAYTELTSLRDLYVHSEEEKKCSY